MSNAFFRIKQYIKMYVQNVYLPQIYKSAVKHTSVNRNKVIFADLHSDKIPYSMRAMYDRLKKEGREISIYCRDMRKMSGRELVAFLKAFMKEYAAAGYVYICSYFLPVSSCDKRPETKVIQLWHSGGLLKKMGYDTLDDIPEYYKGNVTANYDLVTVSSEVCVPVWERALKLPAGITKATGLARTDIYFDDDWNYEKREEFYNLYPDARGKRIVLYAPSFSGNAADPECAGIEGIRRVFQRIDDKYFLIIKLHPNLRNKYPEYFSERSVSISTEDILPVTGILITDYSSVLFDYCLYRRPFILYTPDIDSYKKTRGFYVDIEKFPAPIAKTEEELEIILKNKTYFDYSEQDYEDFCMKYMGECKGNSIDNILKEVEKL
ncbi:CDP-glycerol glycerophosphotransferase, TagB/SpsB family [Lachnospiraceae bacterium]|nr:CDP-glycerol glycerophosphotransferase, TagB/SpsB family [Lachnospiraceae bacterium]